MIFIDIKKNYNIKVIPNHSNIFPDKLKILPDCPSVLFVMGNEKILNQVSISIVGTRNSSEEGNQNAYQFAKELAEKKLIVISGLALGIDSQAHLGTISTGKTIAIIACGFNHINSLKDKQLCNKILDNGGAIISEYFPDVPPKKFSFLHRNRLIAALCDSLLVIEAPVKSGAIETAKIAISLKKPLFIIPWSLQSFRGAGSNKLFEIGAMFLTNSYQLLNYLKNYSPDLFLTISPSKENAILTNSKDEFKNNIPKNYLPFYKFIERFAPVSRELLYSHFNTISISELNTTLTLMELEHFIELKR